MFRHFIYLFSTFFIKIVTNVLLFFIMARIWGPSEFGSFMFAFTLSTLLVIILDYGFSINLVKEIASNRNKVSVYTSVSLFTKLLLLIITVILSLVLIKVYPEFSSETIVLFMVLLCAAVINSFALFLNLPLRAFEYYKIESKISIISNLVLALIILFILFLFKGSLMTVAVGFIIARLIYLFISIYEYKKKFSFTFVNISKHDVIANLKVGFPYAVHFTVGTMYFQIDTVFIHYFMGETSVGMYQAAMRVLIGGLILTDVLNNIYLSRISSLKNSKDKINTGTIMNKYSLLVGLVMGLGLFLLSDLVTKIFFGDEFAGAGILIKLFAVNLFLRYAGSAYGVMLTISGKQKIRAMAVIIALLVNCLLNVVAIPNYGLVGAAISGIITVLILNGIYIYFTFSEYRSLLLKK